MDALKLKGMSLQVDTLFTPKISDAGATIGRVSVNFYSADETSVAKEKTYSLSLTDRYPDNDISKRVLTEYVPRASAHLMAYQMNTEVLNGEYCQFFNKAGYDDWWMDTLVKIWQSVDNLYTNAPDINLNKIVDVVLVFNVNK